MASTATILVQDLSPKWPLLVLFRLRVYFPHSSQSDLFKNTNYLLSFSCLKLFKCSHQTFMSRV